VSGRTPSRGIPAAWRSTYDSRTHQPEAIALGDHVHGVRDEQCGPFGLQDVIGADYYTPADRRPPATATTTTLHIPSPLTGTPFEPATPALGGWGTG
jgi:hypothetical protein